MKKVIIKRKVLSEQKTDLGGGNWVQSFRRDEPTDTIPSGRPADTQRDSASTTQKMVDDEGIKKVVRSALNKVINSKDFGTLVLQAANAAVKSMREEQDQDIIENFTRGLDEQALNEEIETLLEEYGLHLDEGARQFVSSLKKKLGVPLVIGGIMAASLFGTGAQANTPTTFPSVEAAESYVEKSYGTDAKATVEKGTKSMRDLFTGDDSPIQRDQNGDIDWLASLQLDDGTIVTFTR